MQSAKITQHRLVPLLFVIVVANTFGGEIADERSAAVTAVVAAFQSALQRGDGKAAMDLLAPDAMILENGFAQTRAEYERHHLQEDIEFARAVPSVRSVLNAQIDGNVAWIMSTSRTNGTFHEREIDSAGGELMVLSKSSAGWRIRAIHWSSHDNKKTE